MQGGTLVVSGCNSIITSHLLTMQLAAKAADAISAGDVVNRKV